MTTEYKNMVEKIITLLESKENVVFAYIFGSFTSSFSSGNRRSIEQNILEGNNFNDIDIAIYLSNSITVDPVTLEVTLENEMEDILHYPVDIRIINNAPLSFQYNVIKTGIIIIDQDKNLRADFEGLVMKKYFDFINIRNEYLRELTNARV